MAKGLRNKSKRHFRAIKRQTIFAPVEDARIKRLAARQAAAAGNMHAEEEQQIPQTSALDGTSDPLTTVVAADALINNNRSFNNEPTSTSSPIIEVEMADSKKTTSSSKKSKKLTGSLLYSVLGLLDPDEISVTNTASSSLELLCALIDVEEFLLYEK
ncbi:7353_t:CDS:1 [Ambispora gerdemannii]|uniref:7353_t:CDS:1 n=1 Tax=Ambispora gerdemannii TaxID=144530 RepID=A0A9N8Z047_9GLOM|nr:7353_t:CDS:1 [Ambispora gerdemannii]